MLTAIIRSCTGGEARTPDTRFWRPVLYQLSYSRVCGNSHEELCAFAQAAGLTLAGYYEEMTRTPPHADTERAIYVMKKEGALN